MVGSGDTVYTSHVCAVGRGTDGVTTVKKHNIVVRDRSSEIRGLSARTQNQNKRGRHHTPGFR